MGVSVGCVAAAAAELMVVEGTNSLLVAAL